MPRKKIQNKTKKYIFVTGGVMSGVGKGIAASSIALILQSKGYRVTAMKIDPYVNVDAGTMNPTEHGEVFVLEDGMECDQDMGNYERFLNEDLSGINYMTTGSVYQTVINKERNLAYHGKCVEVVPHIPLEVLSRIEKAVEASHADIVVVEIGGTIGEYQNILFLETIRMLRVKHPKDVAVVLVSHVPTQGGGGELKTKPTQHAARALNSAGLQADIIVARAGVSLDKKRKEKIAFNCSVREEDVISAPDVANIYEVPLNFEKDRLGNNLLIKLGLKEKNNDLNAWKTFVEKTKGSKEIVRIGIIGKYFGTGNFMLSDAYISVIEAVKHAAYTQKIVPEIVWLDAESFDKTTGKDYESALKALQTFGGIIVPGGFGNRGVSGKIEVIHYVREHKIPYFGLCYGMQLAVVEFARYVAGLSDANSTEVDPMTAYPVIDVMPEQKEKIAQEAYGGSMRLGAYPCVLTSGTHAQRAYGALHISERHRHRYEVNPEYIEKLTTAGLIFSGTSPDGRLMEIAELPQSEHPFFLGTQFHPELRSRPLVPHPLFMSFLRVAREQKE